MTADLSASADLLTNGALLAQASTPADAASAVLQTSATTLLATEDAGSVGSAYLLFADSLGVPVINKQVSINQQIAGYVANYGPVNSNPAPVPLPPSAWLLLAGLVILGGMRTSATTGGLRPC